MTTIQFDLDDTQAAEAEKIRAGRVDVPDLNELCRLEVVYALGLSPDQIIDKEAAALAEKYKQLSDKDRGDVKVVLDGKVADVVADVVKP